MAREITAGTRVVPRVEEREVKIVSLKSLVFKRFIRHKMAVGGVLIVLGISAFSFIGPLVTPYAPDQVNLRERFTKPSIVMVGAGGGAPALYNKDAIDAVSGDRPLKFGHPLGTDDLGRDTMTRAMFGGRVSLGIGFLVSITSVIIGSTFGAVAGYFGSVWDNILMRINDVNQALPELPVLMVISKILPPGFWTMCVILTVLTMLRSSRITRAMTLTLKQQLSARLRERWAPTGRE